MATGKMGAAGGRNGGRAIGALLLATTALATGLQPVIARADTGGQIHGPLLAQSAERSFDIAAQPLSDALIEFGRQAGYQVSMDAELVEGRRAAAVRGTMDWQAALDALLAGTGLTYRLNGSMVSLVARDGSSGAAIQLAPIRVDADATGGSPYEPVDGFVATRSAVATKTGTPVLETPQAISTVTRDQVEIRNAQTDAQALLYTPGVWAQPFGGQTSPANPFFYFRGFPSSFGGSYVDGLTSPVNYRYEPFGSERLDVFRGPTSALYGRSDPGGMVNRTTKRPTDAFQGELQLQGGTFERRQAAVDISGPIDAEKRFLYRFTGLVREADAPTGYDFGRDEPDDRTYIAPAFTVRPTQDTTFTLLTSHLEETLDSVSVVRDENGAMTKINVDQPGVGTYEAEQSQIGYALEHRFTDGLELRQNARWSTLEVDNLGFYQDSIDPATTTVERSVAGFSEEREDIAIDTHVEGKVRTGMVGHTILVGVDYQKLRDNYSFSWGPAPSLNYAAPDYDQKFTVPDDYLHDDSETDNVGLYLQEQAKIGDNWVVTLGLRHDWASTTLKDEQYGGETDSDDQEFTYRAGVNYVTESGISPYISYATSFFPAGGADINGTPFEPTTGEQYEVGVKYQPPGFNGFFSASVYQLTRQNVTTPDPNFPNFSVQTGEVRSRGIELEGTVDLSSGLRATVAYSYNDAEITKDNPNASGISAEGNRPNLTPEHLASAWVDYTIQSGALQGLLFGGGVRYVSSSYGDKQNTIENDAYTLFDAVIRYDLGQLSTDLAGASLAINADNLLDKEYTTCFSAFDCNWGTERTVMATLRYKW